MTFDAIAEWLNRNRAPDRSRQTVQRCPRSFNFKKEIGKRRVARRTGENPTGCPVCYKLRLEQQKSEILVSSDIHEPLTRGKSVKCIETGEIFASASAAERVMRARGKSVSGSKVLMCCKGERNSSGGHHWEWG
jgi:hypothetical protein